MARQMDSGVCWLNAKGTSRPEQAIHVIEKEWWKEDRLEWLRATVIASPRLRIPMWDTTEITGGAAVSI